MLNRFCDVSQTATPTWICFFATAFSSPHSLADISLDVRLACLTNVVAYILSVIAEAVAERHGVFRLLNSDAHRERILSDDIVTQCRNVNGVAVRCVAEVIGLGCQNFLCIGLYQALDSFSADRFCFLAIHRTGRYVSFVRNDTTL